MNLQMKYNKNKTNDIIKLIKKAKHGDESAFELIFNSSQGIIVKICNKYCFNDWDKDDMKQEARIILYQIIKKVNLKNDKNSFSKKFYGFYQTSLNNHFLNQWRKEHAKKRNHMQDIVEYDDNQNTYDYYVKEESETYLLTKVSLDQISNKYLSKEEYLLIKSRIEGHSIKECSKKLKHGTKYTSDMMKKVRKILRKEKIFKAHENII